MKVFISYRRDDSQVESTSIYRELSREIGEENIFFDVDNIPVGVNFKTYLQNAVTECGLMLVIIGKEWADARDQDGERRLEDPRDFVRIELESALTQGLTIVPVLVRGAKMPKAAALPEPLKDFVFLNAAEIAWGRDFDSHIKRLLRDINSIRTTPPAAPAPATAPPQVTDAPQPASAPQTGTLTWPNGDRYEGEHVDNLPHGQGVFYFVEGGRYEGECVDGKLHGQGIYYSAEGHRYEGEFVDGKMHGQGITYLANGDRYEGEFVDGVPWGQGIYYWANGDRYEGECAAGKVPLLEVGIGMQCPVMPHGQGIYYYANGGRYEGEHVDGVRCGQGIFYFLASGPNQGDRYEGEFADGREHGQGIYYYLASGPNQGDRYEGEHVDGARCGQGIYYFADGRSVPQRWVNGRRFIRW